MKHYQITYTSAGRKFRIRIPARNGLDAREKLIKYVCPVVEDMREVEPDQTNDPFKGFNEDNVVNNLKDIFGI